MYSLVVTIHYWGILCDFYCVFIKMYFVAEREIAQVHQSLLLQHVSHETCGSGGEL